jgi:hypothetical protein
LNDFAKIFDRYDREARLFPAVLTMVPALLFVAVMNPKSILGDFPKNVIVVVVLLALAYVLSGFARSAGKSKQDMLYDVWDGPPTTTMLRHCDANIDDVTKGRYHAALTRMCTGISWPSITDEATDPTAADATYASAVGVLRARRRGEDHSLVLKENASYGFRRNMYGLKSTAIALALLAMAIATGLLIAELHGSSSPATWAAMIAADPRFGLLALADLAIALFWFSFVRPSWVWQAARDYAKALLSTLDLETDL